MEGVREFHLRLNRILLGCFSHHVARRGDALELVDEGDVLRVNLERAGDEVVVVEEERSHGRKPQAHSVVVLCRGLGFGEGHLSTECELPGER